MDDLSGALETLGKLLDDAREVVAALRATREQYTDWELEAIEAKHPAIAALLSACIDLEATLGD